MDLDNGPLNLSVPYAAAAVTLCVATVSYTRKNLNHSQTVTGDIAQMSNIGACCYNLRVVMFRGRVGQTTVSSVMCHVGFPDCVHYRLPWLEPHLP